MEDLNFGNKKKRTKKKTKRKAKTKAEKKAERDDFSKKKIEKFYQRRAELESFMNKDEMRPIISKLKSLIADYNVALREVTDALRADAKGVGPKKRAYNDFKVTRIQRTNVDVPTLTEAVPLDELEEVGAVETKVKYKTDRDKLLELVAAGELPQNVLQEATSVTESTPQIRHPFDELIL